MRRFAKKFKENPKELLWFNKDLMAQFGYYKHLLWLFNNHHKDAKQAISAISKVNIFRIKTECLPKLEMTAKEMEAIALQFFKAISPTLYERAVQVTKHENYIINEPVEKPTVKSYAGNGNDGFYCEISPQNNARGLVTTAHELMHSTGERLYSSKGEEKGPDEDCIGEIESEFIEELKIDYMQNMKIIDRKTADKIRATRIKSMFCDICAIAWECEAMQQFVSKFSNGQFLEAEDVEDIMNSLAKSPLINYFAPEMREKEIENVIKVCTLGQRGISKDGMRAEYSFRYVVGKVVGNELHKQYEEDPTVLDRFVTEIHDKNLTVTLSDVEKFVGKPFDKMCTEYIEDSKKLVDSMTKKEEFGG